jgi:hypothetical protein
MFIGFVYVSTVVQPLHHQLLTDSETAELVNAENLADSDDGVLD